MNPLIDILILSNGPGEITTWVRPTVAALRHQQPLGLNLRISVILSPCPHAMGNEATVVEAYDGVDRVQGAAHFWPFLLWGQTAEAWDWSPQGVVLFLGGDQFFTLAIAKRLGYRSVVYAEWEARWWRWINRFGVMKPDIINRISPQYRDKFHIVGDLMADVSADSHSSFKFTDQLQPESELIGLLPGSKPTKLILGVPLTLAIAQQIHNHRPQTQFIIPVAPTVDLPTLARYADPELNPIIHKVQGLSASLKQGDIPYLETPAGLKVHLWTSTPAYDLLSHCQLCITTIGANTAELGALAVPMVVLIPTHQLDVMRAWEGIPGILANLPLFGSWFARGINGWVLRQGKRFAWPNIWAQREIVPEYIGQLTPTTIANVVLDYLDHPDKLAKMREDLRQVRGDRGAAAKLAQLVIQEVSAA